MKETKSQFKIDFVYYLIRKIPKRTSLIIYLNLLCVFTSCKGCDYPAIPLHGRVEIAQNDSGQSEAKYKCDPGFEIFGPKILRCSNGTYLEREIPFCGVNVALGKPVNQSSFGRNGSPTLANDGYINKTPDEPSCSETLKEPSPWWRVDLHVPFTIRAVRITTRDCCGNPPLQDLEIRVGNSSLDLQRNPLCAWHPGAIDEGATKTFICARPLTGQFVVVQMVGVDGSLSLCEVEVFSTEGLSIQQCGGQTDENLRTFSGTCYDFHISKGDTFDNAQKTCKELNGNLLNNFKGSTQNFIFSELERRKNQLKTNLVWIGAQKDPNITSSTWNWINGDIVSKPAWGKDQPNNYNGEQNCVVLDGGRNWLWNDVGCNLDYLLFICQYEPLNCGSPDVNFNTTTEGKNFRIGGIISYHCPKGYMLVGEQTRTCNSDGKWTGHSPNCQFVDCGPLPSFENGNISLSEKRTTFGVEAVYNCNENFTINGTRKRTCSLNGWDGLPPKCLENWCPEPPHISGGKVHFDNQQTGATAIYECISGYVMFGEPKITCLLGGDWSGKPPTCRFVDCGAPVRPDHSTVVLFNNLTTVGAIVQYECERDYWLIGSKELYCTKEGKWSSDAPICELVTCEQPNVPPGSYVVGYDYNVHSSIFYHCDQGHILRGPSKLLCLSTGEWNMEPPFCEFIDCGEIANIANGSYQYLHNKTYFGSEVVFKCSKSFKLVGATKITCLESGQWSEEAPKCKEIRCPEPPLAQHSILSVTGNDRMYGRTLIKTMETLSRAAQTYRIGALAKYRCERGYKIVGDALTTCDENGSWSGRLPTCIYVDCGLPGEIENGNLTLINNATYYGATVLYECLNNYKLDGISRRLCLENGTWSNETPKCAEITCGNSELNDGLVVNVTSFSIGGIANYSCLKGRFIVGNKTRSCIASGRWSGKVPFCKSIDCGKPKEIKNGRVIVVNESTVYGGSAEYHCIPNFIRSGPYLRKCLENGKWSGEEPQCELIVNDLKENSDIGTNVAIGVTIIGILLIILGIVFLHKNKARPIKNTENIQAAETKDDRNAAVVSYSSVDNNIGVPVCLKTFQTPSPGQKSNKNRNTTENIYDRIPNEQFYDAPYEMRMNEEVYEPEPNTRNVVTINGISVG